MFRNYLKIALRYLRRQKGYTAINVAGLGVGLACCFLIALFVWHELSYDRFHENVDRIHRVVSTWDDLAMPTTGLPLVDLLQENEPDLAMVPMVRTSAAVRYEERQHRETNILFVPPSFFDVFSFELVQGRSDDALAEPNQVVLSESTARKYFGDTNPVGETIEFFGALDFVVSGVIADAPSNSHFEYDFLVSWETLESSVEWRPHQGWHNNSIYVYVRIPEQESMGVVAERIRDLRARHAPADMTATLSLQPMTSIHLHSNLQNELGPNGRAAYVYLFIGIALLILLIACINYMNLATARYAARAREVGVRKAVGADRGQVIGQFLVESVVLTAAGFLAAVALAYISFPVMESLTGQSLGIDGAALAPFMLAGLGFCGVIGLLAGTYPAVFLSGFSPAGVLRGGADKGRAQGRLRQGLVVFQLTLSIALIVVTIGMQRQLDYLRTTSVGFDQEQVVMVPGQAGQLLAGHDAFREQVLQSPHVLEVALASEQLPSELLSGNGIRLPGTPVGSEVPVRTMHVSTDFFSTLGAEFAYGRDFSREFPTDTAAVIVNETAARLLANAFPDQIPSIDALVGQEIDISSVRTAPVIGVVRDFHATTLHRTIPPMLFTTEPSYNVAYARVEAGRHTDALDALREIWGALYPAQPFEYTFLDAAYDAQYRSEERVGATFLAFTLLAIFIACLGLFGLAAFTAQQRTKEIGIRKVLGATVPNILVLLTKDFARLVVVAFVIAAPLAYLGMSRWLEDFAYRVEIGPGLFLGAGMLALAIALLTVSYHAVRAALSDPVRSLRYE